MNRKRKVKTATVVSAPVEAAPFNWSDVLAEIKRMSPCGTGHTIKEIAGQLGIDARKAAEVIRYGLSRGLIEIVRDTRTRLNGAPLSMNTFRLRKP